MNHRRKTKSQKRIYLDHAALTPVSAEVLTEMAHYSGVSGTSGLRFGNPSSIYAEGVAAKKAIDSARRKIADSLHGHTDELIFTGSGTEANNLAVAGTIEALLQNEDLDCADVHMIVSTIEHASVLEAARAYERKGVRVDYLGVDENGLVNPDELKKMIRPNTVLISIMHVNNEIGTIQPIGEIAKVVRHARHARSVHAAGHARKNRIAVLPAGYPYLHVDACQSPEYVPIDLRSFGADLITFDGQKIYGPRGIGLLWARRAVLESAGIAPIIRGGGQERGLRSGTENIAAICGLARAFEMALDPKRQSKEALRVGALHDYFVAGLRHVFADAGMKEGSDFIFNGSFKASERIANNLNFSLMKSDTEFLLLQLDARGIACSTKSSCLRDEDESYVVRALGRERAAATHSLRFSLGRETVKKDIDFVLKTLSDLL